MRNPTGICLLSAALLVLAFGAASCSTENLMSCKCQQTCDGVTRTEDFWLCADGEDLNLNLAWASNVCEAALSTECGTSSCECLCYEGDACSNYYTYTWY